MASLASLKIVLARIVQLEGLRSVIRFIEHLQKYAGVGSRARLITSLDHDVPHVHFVLEIFIHFATTERKHEKKQKQSRNHVCQ
ncbi:hypothetical protein L596_012730 [Steinernema carpocapsae]|uniref:Uncharacterized protein n=1 Tax=Steinernema carpocapsae TaxID=34508 RepID=A0A4U5NY49_STECR|nr:hypothetical protein L596_012730 [Steinernema carpocapsae]